MANSWGIEITQLPDGNVAFRPDRPDATIGQPLGASVGDTVIWTNRTDNTLRLQSIDPPGKYLTDPIPPGQASDPMFRIDGSVTYACVKPPQQQHSIVVPPTS